MQRAAAEKLAEAIDQQQLAPARVLDLACGTGFLTRIMANRFPDAHVIGIDLSPGMVHVATEFLSDCPNVELHVDDALQYQSPEPFDLIVSSSSLQWLRPYDHLMANLKAMLTPDGWTCMTAMLQGTLGELHQLRRELFADKLPSQSLPLADELLHAMTNAGFAIEHQEVHEAMEYYATAREFFASIRAQGFTGGPLSQGAQPLTRGELLTLIETCQQRYLTDAWGVPASYCYGVFAARQQ
ncbi:methyltransferase domain-containing protein [Aeoliella mucimassa]|uniref:methyltransferase domain-containing protein n=1 Tax=Aeoliella mucimassa TaxID=2527972 RepID=UPI001E4BA168|nr:methyltransferase domain-containing protein [Aeoliella mucimassa]